MRKTLGTEAVCKIEEADSILVVEPHSDDAFLSLGWHLEKLWKDKERTILTVFCDKKRAKESSEYAHRIGCNSICLMAEQGGEIPERAAGNYDVAIFPLGLQHEDHLRVRKLAPNDAMFYLDTPYQTKQMNAEALTEAVTGHTLVSIAYPHKMKWRRKEIFKSQAKFFHFNPMQDYKVPEIIVS